MAKIKCVNVGSAVKKLKNEIRIRKKNTITEVKNAKMKKKRNVISKLKRIKNKMLKKYLKSAIKQKYKTGDHRESNANNYFACMVGKIVWNIILFLFTSHTIITRYTKTK